MTLTSAQPFARPAVRNRHRLVVPALWRQVVRDAGKGAEQAVQPEPDRSAYTQLEIYEAVIAAFDRRAEVVETITAAPDRDAAVAGVRSLLGVTHLQAVAVVDLPLHRFTAGTRARIHHRATELRKALTR